MSDQGLSTGVVAALATTPVKGLRLCARAKLMLERGGVADNRRFYLIDERARMVNGKQIGSLSAVRAEYDPVEGRLSMVFAEGTQVSATVTAGEAIETHFYTLAQTAQLVIGPWSEALSAFTGQPLRLVAADPAHGGVDRGRRGGVSVISRASVARLEALADGRSVDSRRFRMLIEVAGLQAHEEDRWVGRTVRIGAARVAINGHVGRCLVTTRNPDSGRVDLPTLELLSYRRGLLTTEPLAFGVFGEVLDPGPVRVGDSVTPE